MITLFKTGEIDYSDVDGIDKPVKYTMENLLEVASRTGKVNITKEHSDEVIGTMSNFIVEDGLLKADEPNNLELKGMGFSPVFNYDLIDLGDYYIPKNIRMSEVGYTKTPRSHIVYNSIEVRNEDNNIMSDDKQLRDALDNNKKLNEEIGQLKSQIKQLKKSNSEKDKEIKEIKDSYSDVDGKLAEYDKLKEIESTYNSMVSSKRDDLIHQIVGDDKEKAERLQHFSIEDLELQIELLSGDSNPKGMNPNQMDDVPLDTDGNVPTPTDDGKPSVDEMIENYRNDFGEDPSFL